MAAHLMLSAVLLLLFEVGLGYKHSWCPEPCQCEEALRHISCQGQLLSSVPQGLPSDLVTLDLSRNAIRTVNVSDFSHLKDVEFIDLSSNQLSFVAMGSFRHNLRLWHLIVDDNLLNVLPGTSFGEHNSLRSLSLARNQIQFVKEDDLTHLKILTALNLTGNLISYLPSVFFSSLNELSVLDLRNNHLIDDFNIITNGHRNLQELYLTDNRISSLLVLSSANFSALHTLDLGDNLITKVNPDWFLSMKRLRSLVLSGNPIEDLDESAFSRCLGIEYLELNELPDIRVIKEKTFARLHQLQELQLNSNQKLAQIHPLAFSDLYRLRLLSLKNNSLRSLSATVLANLSHLEYLSLSGNVWQCDCFSKEFLQKLKVLTVDGMHLGSDFICASPESLQNHSALDVDLDSLHCEVAYKIGSFAKLDCPVLDESHTEVIWITNQHKKYHLILNQLGKTSATENPNLAERVRISHDGNLLISNMARTDGGLYRCVAINQFGNSTGAVAMRLDYTIISTVVIDCLIVGFSAAVGFFGFAVIFGLIRICAFKCSEEERVKRKSIHEVLNSIRNSSQLDRFSAYRTAKLDQFSAFRSATMDQLSAFTTAKISKLRTYKQMTVTNVLQHLERMRMHYSMQTARIKDSCSLQFERLRENYAAQKARLRGQRSQHIRKIRENYNAQALRIRECRTQQMVKLREQYKLQQQHLLKLLELLDVGNCITVIEAECVRTESTIFDADIAFDLEAQSIHAPQSQASHSSFTLNDLSESSSLAEDHNSLNTKEEDGDDVTQLDNSEPPDKNDFVVIIAELDDAMPAEISLDAIITEVENEISRLTAGKAAVVKTPVKHFSEDVVLALIEKDVSISVSSLDVNSDATLETVL